MNQLNSLKLSFNLEQLESWSQKLGSRLRGDELIELSGDIGSGKTTMTKAILLGAGSNDTVSSPSFTIKNEYRAAKFIVYHFDFYRLDDPGLIKNQLIEDIDKKNRVIIIEWSKIVSDVLSNDRVIINFQTLDINDRQLTINWPNKLNYLIKGL